MLRYLLAFVLVLVVSEVSSQDFRKFYGVAWDINKPLSNQEFIDRVSTRGAKFIYRELISNRFGVGGELGFATYSDRIPPQVYQNGTTSVFAEVFGYVYNYSLTISGEYYFTEETWLKPFAGLGVGAMYNRMNAYYNVFGEEDRVWGAVFRPNAGVLMRFSNKSRWAARLSVRYDYATTKSVDFDYNNFTSLGADAGLVFILR